MSEERPGHSSNAVVHPSRLAWPCVHPPLGLVSLGSQARARGVGAVLRGGRAPVLRRPVSGELQPLWVPERGGGPTVFMQTRHFSAGIPETQRGSVICSRAAFAWTSETRTKGSLGRDCSCGPRTSGEQHVGVGTVPFLLGRHRPLGERCAPARTIAENGSEASDTRGVCVEFESPFLCRQAV